MDTTMMTDAIRKVRSRIIFAIGLLVLDLQKFKK